MPYFNADVNINTLLLHVQRNPRGRADAIAMTDMNASSGADGSSDDDYSSNSDEDNPKESSTRTKGFPLEELNVVEVDKSQQLFIFLAKLCALINGGIHVERRRVV